MVTIDSIQELTTTLSRDTAPSLTPYDVPFSYNTCMRYGRLTDRRQRDGQTTDRAISWTVSPVGLNF